MNRAAVAVSRCLLLAVTLADCHAVAAQPGLETKEFDLTGGVEQLDNRDAEKSLLEAIGQIESRDGAYAADLPEQMLSLGLALQQQDRHGEAVDVFKRGVHLARINQGLYCTEQIPLLQGEITSSIALGQYARVDELQQYLYRVEMRGMGSGEDRAAALVKQATWQFNAYQLGLGEQGAERLATMWDLYRLAWSDIGETEPDTSPKLLPPLYGLLRTQYLISEYRADTDQSASSFSPGYANTQANRFYAYRAENYELGKSVILAIYKIQRSERGQDSNEAVEALVGLGDWALWNDRVDDAAEIYRLALAELGERDGAKEEQQRLFGEPVPLPDINGLRDLPPAVGADQGNILVEFRVDNRGRVVDLERQETGEELDTAADRLLRILRNTKFRPRLEAGQLVGTDKLVRAYDVKP
ncbi:MAG: energy transducer TonB [Gammaproteobacteria bacterium]|jgi:hypothetical protein|nr:energy transducer TonB [Gammaproteobacteria bacterium]